MHELSICRGLLRQLERISSEHGSAPVTAARIRIGPLSGVVPELLAEAFAAASPGSCAEGAGLTIEHVPLRVRCQACGATTQARANHLLCGCCGDHRTRLLSGDELLLAGVTLAGAEESCHV